MFRNPTSNELKGTPVISSETKPARLSIEKSRNTAIISDGLISSRKINSGGDSHRLG